MNSFNVCSTTFSLYSFAGEILKTVLQNKICLLKCFTLKNTVNVPKNVSIFGRVGFSCAVLNGPRIISPVYRFVFHVDTVPHRLYYMYVFLFLTMAYQIFFLLF